MESDDVLRKVCTILKVDNNEIITFEDFIEAEFKVSYDEIKNDPQIGILRKAWNISCESLLNVLDGISLIAKELNIKKEKR